MDTMHVTWTPEASELTEGEREKIVERIKARADKCHEQHAAAKKALAGLPYVAVPIDQLADIYERFLRLTRMGQSTIEGWLTLPKDVADLKRKIFDQSDFGAIYAGQWLPRDICASVREKLAKENAIVNMALELQAIEDSGEFSPDPV